MPDYTALAASATRVSLRRRYLTLAHADQVRADIRTCRACGLNRTRARAVPFEGEVGGRAVMVVVGEAPGRNEDQLGRPFVGRAGKLLDKALLLAGTNRSEVFLMNTVCCRPPGNREPEVVERDACYGNFKAQLDLAGCWLGVAVGNAAWRAVNGSGRIGEDRGEVFWVGGMVWIPTWHPAFVLRQTEEGEKGQQMVGDLTLAVNMAKSCWPLPGKVLDQVAKQLPVKLAGWKWAKGGRWASKGGRVVVRDQDTRVPGTYADLPRWTLAEMVRVGWKFGREIEMAKRGLGAVVESVGGGT